MEELCDCTLNKILQIGEVDDVVKVWRLHRMMVVGSCDSEAQKDIYTIVKFGIAIITSYLDSDIHDAHDPDMVALSALKFLQQLLVKVCAIRMISIFFVTLCSC